MKIFRLDPSAKRRRAPNETVRLYHLVMTDQRYQVQIKLLCPLWQRPAILVLGLGNMDASYA